jgi:hypothetical protein
MPCSHSLSDQRHVLRALDGFANDLFDRFEAHLPKRDMSAGIGANHTDVIGAVAGRHGLARLAFRHRQDDIHIGQWSAGRIANNPLQVDIWIARCQTEGHANHGGNTADLLVQRECPHVGRPPSVRD